MEDRDSDTQGVPLRAAARDRILGPKPCGWLLQQRELRRTARAGNTCLSDLLHDQLEAPNTSNAGIGGLLGSRQAKVSARALMISTENP